MSYTRTKTDALLSEQQVEKVKKCEICKAQFSLMLPAHLCKRCYKCVCSSCGDREKVMPSLLLSQIVGCLSSKDDSHRKCHECRDESQAQQRLILKHNLIWGQNSTDITKKWLHCFQIQM